MDLSINIGDVVVLAAVVGTWLTAALKDRRISKDELVELVGILAEEIVRRKPDDRD